MALASQPTEGPKAAEAPHYSDAPTSVWLRRFLIGVTILTWAGVAWLALYLISLIGSTFFLIVISCVFAFILYPLVKMLRRVVPLPVAVIITILGMLAFFGLLLFTIGAAVVQQVALMVAFITHLLDPKNINQYQWLVDLLKQFGVTPASLQISGQQIIDLLRGVTGNVLGIALNVVGTVIEVLAATTIVTYLLFDGIRIINWLRTRTPLRYRANVNFLLDTMDEKLGGFLRGQVILAFVMSALLGAGAYFIGVPYIAVYVVIVFVAEFIPIIGGYIAGVVGILFALTVGWQTALIMTVFIILMLGGLEGQVLIPRITGRAVELHPMLTLVALLIGADLFGIPGAIFAAPVAGVLQVIVVSYWTAFRRKNPGEFPEDEPIKTADVPGLDALADQPAAKPAATS